jgi:hypothetical protein
VTGTTILINVLPNLLLADIGEVIGSLVGLLMLLLWVVNQIMEGKKQAGRPAGQRPVAPAQRPAPQGAAGPQAAAKPQAGGGLRGEVEDFLRRAAVQQPAGQAQANRPAPPRPAQAASRERIEVLVDERGQVIERRRPAEVRRPSEPRIPGGSTPARPAGKPAGAKRPTPQTTAREPLAKRESVADHVRQHIDAGARAVGQQASQLGQRIVKEDAEFDVQLNAKFDHEVGRLASKVRVTDTPSQSPVNTDTTSPAALLSAMLANPLGVQQAILMNEILRRPIDRW